MGLRRLTGLFLKDGKAGKYMSGAIRDEITLPLGTRLLLFKNDRKANDRDPDYVLNIAEDDAAPQQQKPAGNPYHNRSAERQRSADTDQRQRLDEFESERQAAAGGNDAPPW